jgi:predicted nucleic acid-binding protein
MERFSGATLLSDDRAARQAAAQLSYPFLGTIGVVLRSLDRRLRTKRQVLSLLRSIPHRSTLHIRPSVLNTIIAQVEASPP